jgi:hypothetical protein
VFDDAREGVWWSVVRETVEQELDALLSATAGRYLSSSNDFLLAWALGTAPL